MKTPFGSVTISSIRISGSLVLALASLAAMVIVGLVAAVRL